MHIFKTLTRLVTVAKGIDCEHEFPYTSVIVSYFEIFQLLRSRYPTTKCSASRRQQTAPCTAVIWPKERPKRRCRKPLDPTDKFKKFAYSKTKDMLLSGAKSTTAIFKAIDCWNWRNENSTRSDGANARILSLLDVLFYYSIQICNQRIGHPSHCVGAQQRCQRPDGEMFLG